jgi:hypothetical protein
VVFAAGSFAACSERYDRWACGRGEIGNRAGFRCPCSKELEGSSPSARTHAAAVFSLVDGGFHVCQLTLGTLSGHMLGTLSSNFA